MVRTRLVRAATTATTAAVATAAAGLLAACGSSLGTPNPGPVPAAATPGASSSISTPVAEGTLNGPQAQAGSGAVTDMAYLPGTPVWWSGFEIELVSAHLDTATGGLEVQARLTNTSPVDTNLGATRAEISVGSPDHVTAWDTVSDTIPHGTTLPSSLRFPSVPDDFDLSTAQLVLGGEGDHQAVFALGDKQATATAVATRPRAVPATVVISNAHTGARFESRDVSLLAAACSGTNPVDVTYVPLASDQLVLELVGTIRSPSRSVGGVAAQRATATPAGGEEALAEPGLGLVLGADAPPVRRLHLCFPLPADTHGRVDLAFDTRLVGEDFVTATGSVQLP
ncbi:hypothetical protein [Terracoccus sp. 273MFTsu3.1]|uniref:hypothetical protein n=1 Tax=Terracoccus sp. 273MFTsu3.1 TaxID=1172188 RepID=UPI00037AC289|nr:hypothetical protein [Terracoccus sp. 273MFTsu3.1]